MSRASVTSTTLDITSTTAITSNGQRTHTRFAETTATNNDIVTDDEDDAYSDEVVEEEDSDYEPIDIAAWGTTTIEKQDPQSTSWGTLADPDFKVKPGELGSGSLHRRGGNFKPISEEYIIAQRKGKVVPGSGKRKSRGGKKKKPATAASRPPVRPSFVTSAIRRTAPPPPVPSYCPPVRQPPANSPWANQQLVETPFWEQKKVPVVTPPFVQVSMQKTPTPILPPIIPSPSISTTSITSRIITTSTNNRLSEITTTNNIPKFNAQAEGFTPSSSTSSTSAARKSWNTDAASFEPHTTFSVSTTTSPIPKFNPNVPTFNSFNPTTAPTQVPNWSQNIIPSNWDIALVQYNYPTTTPLVPVYATTTPSPSPLTTTTTLSTPNSSTSSSTTTVTSRHTFNTYVPEFLPFVQIPEKKPVKITSPPPLDKNVKSYSATSSSKKQPSMFANNPLLRRQLQQINQGISGSAVNKATPPSTTTTEQQMQQLNLDTQTGPESTRGLEEPKPLIQLNMELAPGISTEILVYENSIPSQLADDFATHHRLNVTNTAKAKIAATISQLLQEKKGVIAAAAAAAVAGNSSLL